MPEPARSLFVEACFRSWHAKNRIHFPAVVFIAPTASHNSIFFSVINTGYEMDKSFFITTKHKAFDGQRQPMATGPTRDSKGKEETVVTLVIVVKPRGVIEACYLDISDAQACGKQQLDLFSDIKSVQPHPDPSAWETSRAYPFPLGGNSPRLCSQVKMLAR